MLKLISYLAVAVLAIPFLNGCATPASREEVSAATQTQLPSTPDRWANQSAEGDVAVDWVRSFNDPVLIKLVQQAQVQNRNLQAAAANVERAWALAAQAGAALQPSVNLALGSERSGVVDGARSSSSEQTVGLGVNWELDVWGRLRAASQAAVASAEAAAADYRYAQHSLAASVIKTYVTIIEANVQVQVARENLSALQETLRIVDAKYANGVASSQDVALTRSDLAAARERLTQIEGSQRDAKRALEILLGQYPDAELAVRETLPDIPPPAPAGVPSEILERRPDVIAAERRIAAAFNAVDQAKAARLPVFSLTGNLGGSSNLLSDVLKPANVGWQAAANLLAPLVDGGARKAQVKVSTAEQQQALAAYGQTALEAFAEVENNLDQGVVLVSREADLQEVAREARQAYRIAQLRYKEGEVDLLDVLTIQQRVIAAESNLVSVQRQLLEQRVNLHLALGGSWLAE